MSPNPLKIKVNVYGASYDQNLVKDILDKNLSFEVSFSNGVSRDSKLLTLDQIQELKSEIDNSIQAYMDAIFVD